MKYAAHNALGILKNSVCYVIVSRHVAPKQRMIGRKMRFRTSGSRHRRYNRYKLMPLDDDRELAAGPNNYFSAFNKFSATLASETTRGATCAFSSAVLLADAICSSAPIIGAR